MRAEDEAEFRDYAAARITPLRRTAYLLCGDWHLADDLVQTTLTKLYGAWRRVQHKDAIDGYTRQILVRAFLSERRRPWRREAPMAVLPDRPAGDEQHDDRAQLMAALARVPARQRAVLVLRYWDDNSIERTAELLGCSQGTVKSQAARGLAALRVVLDQAQQAPLATSSERTSDERRRHSQRSIHAGGRRRHARQDRYAPGGAARPAP